MSIRCAVCGSKGITMETKKEGYNKKKGILGSVFFGGMGAILGVNGNEITYYHCGDCGHTLTNPMSDIEANEIDNAILNGNVEKIKFLKQKYKNIEYDDSKVIFNEKEIPKTVEKMAGEISNYFKAENKSSVADMILKRNILGAHSSNELFDEAIELLIKKGVLTVEKKEGIEYYTFYTSTEDINNNLNKIKIKDEANKIRDNLNENKKIAFKEDKLFNILLELLEKEKELPIEESIKRLEKIFMEKGYSNNIDIIKELAETTINNGIRFRYLNTKTNEDKSISIFKNENRNSMTGREILEEKRRQRQIEREKQRKIEDKLFLDEYKDSILNCLNGNKKLVINDMYASSSKLRELSIGQLCGVLRTMMDLGLVKREKIGKATYFSLTRLGNSTNNSSSISPADEIKKYKELLDMGAITTEEFNKKKSELLKL